MEQQSRDYQCHAIQSDNLLSARRCPFHGLKLVWNCDLAPPTNPDFAGLDSTAVSALLRHKQEIKFLEAEGRSEHESKHAFQPLFEHGNPGLLDCGILTSFVTLLGISTLNNHQ